MTLRSSFRTEFLRYVENTNGGATKKDFVEDWEPIGERVWDDLWAEDLIELDEHSRVRLTSWGREQLKAPTL